MSFEFIPVIKEKATDLLDDAREGLSLMDRYLVTSSVRTKTVITDTKNGKRLVDTEDGYTREFSLFKAVVAGLVVFATVCAVVLSLCNASKTKKKLRKERKELKRIKKLCKKSGVVIDEELPF